MSAIVKGVIVDTNLSRQARGGTEQMRSRLLKYVDKSLLGKVVIHFSRVRQENLIEDIPNIFYAHDLVYDPENKILANGGYKRFAKIVFVSYWQRDQYMLVYGIPYSHCTVIENAIELEYEYKEKSDKKINFIYHTTPHRGLELLYPIFNRLTEEFDSLHLDVYSSFGVYGWPERDKPYELLFSELKKHKHISYHGAQSNEVVLEALQKAHIFLYPCIWQETSCIAMIEAIKSGCMVIHPNLAALPETAAGSSLMYDFHENNNTHAQRAYLYTRKVLLLEKEQPGFIDSFSSDVKCELPKNSIEAFAGKWIDLLVEVTR